MEFATSLLPARSCATSASRQVSAWAAWLATLLLLSLGLLRGQVFDLT